MSFHDRRIRGPVAEATATKAARRQLMFRGVRKINIWQHLPAPALGTTADDWKSVGEDIRSAMTRYAYSE